MHLYLIARQLWQKLGISYTDIRDNAVSMEESLVLFRMINAENEMKSAVMKRSRGKMSSNKSSSNFSDITALIAARPELQAELEGDFSSEG